MTEYQVFYSEYIYIYVYMSIYIYIYITILNTYIFHFIIYPNKYPISRVYPHHISTLIPHSQDTNLTTPISSSYPVHQKSTFLLVTPARAFKSQFSKALQLPIFKASRSQNAHGEDHPSVVADPILGPFLPGSCHLGDPRFIGRGKLYRKTLFFMGKMTEFVPSKKISRDRYTIFSYWSLDTDLHLGSPKLVHSWLNAGKTICHKPATWEW